MIIKNTYILVTLLLISCSSNCVKLDLSQDQKDWFKSYSLNDTVTFQSENDTIRNEIFIVKEKTDKYEDCNRFEKGKFIGNECAIFLKPLNFNFNEFCFFTIKFTQKEDTVYKIFLVHDLHARHSNSQRPPENKRVVRSNFKDSLDVIEFRSNYSAKSTGDKVDSFQWSKDYGLISYKLKDGQTFSLKSINNKTSW